MLLISACSKSCVSIFVPVFLATVATTLAGVPEDFRYLLNKRDALAAALGKQPIPQELLLRFDEGADRDDVWVTLRRADGAWREAYAEVPGWLQATMKDWRAYYHGNYTHGCWRPNQHYAVDTAALTLDDRHLSGAMGVAYKLDWPFLSRNPPGEYVQWWDKFIPGGNTLPRRVDYTVRADVRADSCLLDLVLDGGVYWDSTFVTNSKTPAAPRTVARRPIFLRLQAPGSRFASATVKTPSWVGGFHEADTTGLKFADGHLTGALIVFLHQDGWSPWGGGKHTQHEPIAVHFEVDAKLERNELTGRYTASFGGELKGKSYNPRGDDSVDVTLPDTRYDGAIRGCGGKRVVGRYAATGDFGEQVGVVDGMLLDDRRPVREHIEQTDGEITVEKIGAVLHQIRALHLALQHATLSFEEAWLQTDRAAPASAGIAEYLDLARRMIDALQPPAATPPVAKAETAGESPSFGAQPAPVEGDFQNVLPAGADGWLFLTRWRVLGPFEQRSGLEHDTALAPDLVVLPDAVYRQPRDRFGLNVDSVSTQCWQTVVCSDMRLGAPWERAAFFVRYVGQVWYGAASLRSDRPRTVWLSLEANDFAKLWVNDRLVWTDTERAWRYRPFGRSFVPVALVAGDNRILARIHGDRQLSWLRLALTAREPATPAPAPAQPASATPHFFPDAQPPLAWNIAKGINVAWRNAELGGATRPTVVGDAVFVTGGAGALFCVDAATGKTRWSRGGQDESASAGGRGAPPPFGAAVSDGKRIAFLSGGSLGCYDPAGSQLWTNATQLTQARLQVCGTRLIVEGQAAGGERPRGAGPTVRALAFDAATGREAWRRDLPGAQNRDGLTLTAGNGTFYLSGTGALLDPATGELLPALDGEMELTGKDGAPVRDVTAEPYRIYAGAGMLYLTSEARHLAMRLWTRDGKLGWAQAWESNYGSSGFGNVPAPGMATDRYLFTWHSSLAHTPHSPDPRAEVNVQDARDGRWIARRKPVMDDLYSYGALNLSMPVVAGNYLFLLGGRSDNSRNRMAVVSADDRLRLVARQDVEPGTTKPPVFAGDRMFLRSPQSLLCVAATTPEGRQYQKEELARTMLREIGREPRPAIPLEIAGLDRVDAIPPGPPGKLLNERPTEFWIGAGPFPAGILGDAAALAALRPVTGAVFFSKSFAPLSREFAYNEPPAYIRTSELQGTGDITPRFNSRVNPQCVSGPTGAGLLYTVLDNVRDRVVLPVLARKGIAQWLGGQALEPGVPLHLAPGLYPYLVRVDPEFYQPEEQEILPPVNVTNALAKGALRDVGWPKNWQVLGPVPPRATPLTARQLCEMPETVVVDGWTYPLFSFPVAGFNVNLGCLVNTPFGEAPDYSASFVRAGQPITAYAFASVECPADGYLYMTASCESAMRWYVDGVSVYDRFQAGNGADPNDLNAHPFAVRVTRGRHWVVVQVRPGAAGWSFCSAGGFSEKRGDQLAEFRVESKMKILPPDFRLQPCFQEIPHPPTLRELWLDRVRDNAGRLDAVGRDLPDTRESRQAAAMLERLKPSGETGDRHTVKWKGSITIP